MGWLNLRAGGYRQWKLWRIGDNARKDIIRLFSGNKTKEKFERILAECSMEKSI